MPFLPRLKAGVSWHVLMNKPDVSQQEDDLRPEYGPEVFARAVRGKHYARYQAGTNLALLTQPSDSLVRATGATGKPCAVGRRAMRDGLSDG